MKPASQFLKIGLALIVAACNSTTGQVPGDTDWPPDPPEFGGPPPPGFGGPGGPGAFGGPPGGVQEHRQLVPQFDQNGDRRLDAKERKAAREFLAKKQPDGRGPRRPGPEGRDENLEPALPGPKLSPGDVKSFPDTPLYDAAALRTFFLEFEHADWEKELADFHGTDVEVPAKLTVDRQVYRDVGVHFRGASSYSMIGEGRKRSLNLSLDFVHADQRLYGYRTLNLLNSHEDPTFLRTVLYHYIARQYIPAPKANHVRIVINGESWGVYVNVQQFDKEFIQEWFSTTRGARWKVPGHPGADGGLAYLDDDLAQYQRRYELKSKEDVKSWAGLIHLCYVLNQTPPDRLEQSLQPLLDTDGALKFLALDNVLINGDGYWTRASDYNIYLDRTGRFHIIPYDANETFRMAGGPGFGGGPGRPGLPPNRQSGRRGPPEAGPGPGFGGPPRVNGAELDPLVAANDPSKPLLSKLLAVPGLRARYLSYVQDIAERWLDWNKLGPLAEQWQALIAEDVKSDTRKLDSFEAFQEGATKDVEERGGRGRGHTISLKTFVEKRRAYLLNYAQVKPLAGEQVARKTSPNGQNR